jgi:two-component system response regulator
MEGVMEAKTKIILLIEDSPDDASLTMRALRKSNIPNEVVVVDNGVLALDYLFGTGSFAGRDVAITPQLILLDLHLPGLDGFSVLRQIRANERTRHLPVVIFTSSDEDRDRLETIGLGANSYIRKPLDVMKFTQAVRQLGLYWLALNETARTVASDPKLTEGS